MDYSVYLDVVMIILLIVTIIYAFILNRKLAWFRRSREDMQEFLTAFDAANERAEVSIRALKEMAEQSGEKLREDIEKANALNEDLTFMIDRGESIANRLEKAASDVNAGRRGGASSGLTADLGGSARGSASAGDAGYGKASRKNASDVVDDRVGIETRAEELAARMVRDVESGSGRQYDAYGDGDDGAGAAAGPRRLASSDMYDDNQDDEDAGRSEAERELLAALRSVR